MKEKTDKMFFEKGEKEKAMNPRDLEIFKWVFFILLFLFVVYGVVYYFFLEAPVNNIECSKACSENRLGRGGKCTTETPIKERIIHKICRQPEVCYCHLNMAGVEK